MAECVQYGYNGACPGACLYDGMGSGYTSHKAYYVKSNPKVISKRPGSSESI